MIIWLWLFEGGSATPPEPPPILEGGHGSGIGVPSREYVRYLARRRRERLERNEAAELAARAADEAAALVEHIEDEAVKPARQSVKSLGKLVEQGGAKHLASDLKRIDDHLRKRELEKAAALAKEVERQLMDEEEAIIVLLLIL